MKTVTKTTIESYLLDVYVTGYTISGGESYEDGKIDYTVRFASNDGISGKEYSIPANLDFVREIQDNPNKHIQLEIKILDRN